MKKRISITLSAEVLEQLDHSCMCAGESRSQAAEYLLKMQLSNACARCGVLFPPLWSVPTKVWRHYIIPAHRGRVICRPCWNDIVKETDNGEYLVRYGYGQRQLTGIPKSMHRNPNLAPYPPWDDWLTEQWAALEDDAILDVP